MWSSVNWFLLCHAKPNKFNQEKKKKKARCCLSINVLACKHIKETRNNHVIFLLWLYSFKTSSHCFIVISDVFFKSYFISLFCSIVLFCSSFPLLNTCLGTVIITNNYAGSSSSRPMMFVHLSHILKNHIYYSFVSAISFYVSLSLYIYIYLCKHCKLNKEHL